MNEHDSEIMAGILEKMGCTATDTELSADIIIYNTCLIRENAELKLYGNLGHLKVLKTKNPNLIIAVCGCIPQKKEYLEIIEKQYPYVDLIFGTHNYHELEEFIQEKLNSRGTITHILNERKEMVEHLPAMRKHTHKAFVNIVYGCNNYCSYCVVPYTRGRETSRPKYAILEEIKQLVDQGYSEVTLLGQNVNSYGKDLSESVSFPELLYQIDQYTGIKRLRFMTSHPKDLSNELIYAIKELPSLCEHIHLPLQSGSTRILDLMNRKYTKERYLNIVEKAKQVIPDISLTTDIIVGFPEETDRDFQETINVCEQVKFDSAFTFLYSRRKGTKADEMEKQVPEELKHQRFNLLLRRIKEIAEEKNREEIGKIYEVFIEGSSIDKKNGEKRYIGRTRHNKLIYVKSEKNILYQFVSAKVIHSNTFNFNGQILNQEK